MALCVYHETTEATQACRVCKQDVCAKCLEYGEAGMCGMCVEMANARKATMEAARQARTEAAATANPAQAPRPAAPRPPQGAPPPGGRSPTGPKGPPKSPTGSKGPAPAGAPRGAAPNGAAAPPRAPQKAPTKAGMCAAHQDQKASATCTHCQKKVCPYCLDLYDLCGDCRQLPSCARHESMVSQAKCVSCKMDYCKICLNGTDQCDRCRTIGAPRGEAAKSPTQPLKPRAKATTGKLEGPPGGPAAPGPKPEKVKPASHIYRPNAKDTGVYGKKKGKDLPIPAIAGGAVLAIVLVLFLAMGGGKPALTEEAAVEALQLDMGYVQAAAIAYEAKNGRYPDSEEFIYKEIEAKGINLDKLKLPIKLAVNTPAAEPYQISYRLVGDGFEVRAVDKEGRPFSVGGKDVVLTHKAEGAETPEPGAGTGTGARGE